MGMFMLNVLAVTWPAITFFRAAEPMVLGLPMSMVWPIAWILLGWATLLVLDRAESREDAD